MSSYRNLVIVALLLLLVGGGLAIWNAERKVADTPPPQETTAEQPSMVGKNVSFTVTEGETKKWKLDAAHAIYNESHTQADLTDVKGEFYNAKGEPVLSFTAPKGQYTNKNNAVTLSGGVLAKSVKDTSSGGKGGTMKAPQMVWSAKTDLVTATGGTELTFPEGKSTAQTCKFTLDFSNIELEGNVSSTIMSP
ncbi:MAG: hypothetical protein K0Q50_1233 [Vampirovibrio sp.]|jgi:LPS export ABC transporter protein LptC|nr:hypothetical protein [Vampirovibrio sp.]